MAGETTDGALDQLRERYAELLARLEENQSQFQRLARSALRVQEDERRRIARELHDGIGQNLTAIKHQLAMLHAQLQGRSDAGAERIGACIELCAQTLEDTRQLSRLLRPQVLDDLGLGAALHWLARTLEGDGRLQVAVHLEDVPALDPEIQTLLFRVTQEALANVVKHADASDALVRLALRGGRVWLTVWDNGAGFDVAAAETAAQHGRGSGLAGMRERLALYGGALRIDSGAESGTWLRASVPASAGGNPH
jgi:two-component system sensor histidine kinase UhpB